MNKRKKTDEKGVPYGARKKMPLWFPVAWSSRGVSLAIAVMMVGQITYYCTDILGLNMTVIGTMFLVSKIIDGFTDLGFGFILDKTHTKWGKARPYELFLLLEWLFLVLMFNASKFSTTGQYIWIFIFYLLVNSVCATALGGTDSVYLAKVFTTHENQVSAISINGFIVMFSSILFNIVFAQFLAGAGRTQAGWSKMLLPLAIVMAAIGMLRFIFCKEVASETEEQTASVQENHLSMKESLVQLVHNKYLLIIVALMLLTFWMNGMSAATTYYFKYIVGNLSLMGMISITSLIVLPALVVFPVLTRKLGTTKIMQGCLLIGALGMLLRTIGGTNVATLIIGSCLYGIGTCPISMMINTYLIDCMDYGEWKNGVRIEGMVASIVNFASKVGNGIALGAVGVIMGFAGYDGTAAQQTAGVNRAIVFSYNILPLILFLIMFGLSLMYQVDSVREQMDADLKKKHGEI